MPDLFVICNTSPLFYLHRLRGLDLLQKLYRRITVPGAVVEELRAGREQGEDAPEVAGYEWIMELIAQGRGRVVDLTRVGFVHDLRVSLVSYGLDFSGPSCQRRLASRR